MNPTEDPMPKKTPEPDLRPTVAPAADPYEGLRAARDAETRRADAAGARLEDMTALYQDATVRLERLERELAAAAAALKATT